MIRIGKKKIIILVIIILLLGIGGVFLWQKSQKEIKGSPEDYVVIETEEGKFVENKKAGLTVKAPEGWIEEKVEVMEGSMVFYTPDTESYRPGEIGPPIKKGCFIKIGLVYNKETSFEEIKKEIKKNHKEFAIKEDKIEMMSINGIPALKNEYETPFLGDEANVDIYIPHGGKIYGISLAAARPNIEECYKAFDKFLETVSID